MLKGINYRMLAQFLGCCRNSVKNKMNGKTQWTLWECMQIQRAIAPGYSLETIFNHRQTIGGQHAH